MVRGTWFSRKNKPQTYGLPPLLVSHLRSVLKSDQIKHPSEAPGEHANEDTERALLETIISIFEPMMEGLEDSNNLNSEDLRWDVKLALNYKALQRRIISSVLSSCAVGLQTLGST